MAHSSPDILQVSLLHLELENSFFGIFFLQIFHSLECTDESLHDVFRHVLCITADVDTGPLFDQLHQRSFVKLNGILNAIIICYTTWAT